MLDVVTIDGVTRGIIARNLITGEMEKHFGHAVLLCTGGYGNVFYLSTNAMGSNVTAAWKAHKKGAFFGNPCYTQIHPTCIPVSGDHQSKLTLMSESLRNDGRIWVPKKKDDNRKPTDIPEEERDYYLERRYPAFGNLVPRDVASRGAKERCDAGYGVGNSKMAVYLDFAFNTARYGRTEATKRNIQNPSHEEIMRLGKEVVKEKYGNLFDMYQQITGENPYEVPMRIYPAVHYTMGGVWVDYNLQSTIPGCFVAGEANFSDHGANRLGASALMQGLADGYFVLPYTVSNYLADEIRTGKISTDLPEFAEAENRVKDSIDKFLNTKGTKSVDHFHKRLGLIMWNKVGMGRNEAGLKEAIAEITALKEEFYRDVNVPGNADELNPQLEKALRVADFIDLGQLMAMDALQRKESCGGHFREEYQDAEGETLRDDENFSFVGAWEYKGDDITKEELHKEELKYEFIKIAARNYK
jgi:succinate dehydrogenase / fumarate reductase flavoprotein subunit